MLIRIALLALQSLPSLDDGPPSKILVPVEIEHEAVTVELLHCSNGLILRSVDCQHQARLKYPQLRVISEDDYPIKARREMRGGITYFHIERTLNGRAANCTVSRSSGSADLDKKTCEILVRRLRMKTDSPTGTAVLDGRVVWQAPWFQDR